MEQNKLRSIGGIVFESNKRSFLKRLKGEFLYITGNLYVKFL